MTGASVLHGKCHQKCPFQPQVFCDICWSFKEEQKQVKKLNHPCLYSANPPRNVYVTTLSICTKYPSKAKQQKHIAWLLQCILYFLKSRKKVTHVKAPAKPMLMDPMKNGVGGCCPQCSCRTFTVLLLSGCWELRNKTLGCWAGKNWGIKIVSLKKI